MVGTQIPRPIGYGHSRSVGKWDALYFSGDEKDWELWEERFSCYMRQKKLHTVINTDDRLDGNKNAEAYSELVAYLDNRSVGLIMRDAKNDGQNAMKILQAHYCMLEVENLASSCYTPSCVRYENRRVKM